MFPEYRDLISKLKTEDARFERLFDKHNELDQQIKNMEARIVSASNEEIDTLKKEKLALKDELYQILSKASASQHAAYCSKPKGVKSTPFFYCLQNQYKNFYKTTLPLAITTATPSRQSPQARLIRAQK